MSWIPSGNNLGTTGLTTPDCTVSWDNNINASARTIAVYIVYKNSGSQVSSASASKNVVIKTIGNISSMSVSGAVTANPSNGGSVSVTCGSQSITISVPALTTNPSSGLIYTWSLPAGWSGSSTSNSISVNTSAGDGGTISVSARRSDSNCNTDAYSFTATRPLAQQPSVAASSPANDNAICANEYKFYSASSTNATTYRWVISPSISSYTYSNIIAISPTTPSILVAYANNACNVESASSLNYYVYYGPPTIATATVNGGSQQSPNYGQNPFLLNINTNTAEGGLTYDWTTLQGTGNIYYNGNNSVAAYVYPFARIQGAITNRCGTGSTIFYLYNQNTGFYSMTSPNPATNTVSANIKAMTVLKSVSLVSHSKASVVRSFDVTKTADSKTHKDASDNISFDVDDLPRGMYYLNFSFEGNKNFTEQIVLH